MRTVLVLICAVGLCGCEEAMRRFWGWPDGDPPPSPAGCMALAAERGWDVDWKRVVQLGCNTEVLGYTVTTYQSMAACEAEKANDVAGVCGACYYSERCCRHDTPDEDPTGNACSGFGEVVYDGEDYRRGREVCFEGAGGANQEPCAGGPDGGGGGGPEPDAAVLPAPEPECDPVVEPDLRDFGLRGDECTTEQGALGRFVCEGGEPVCRPDPTRNIQQEVFGRVTPEASQAAFQASATQYLIGLPWAPDPQAIRLEQREVGNLYELWVRRVLEPVWLARIRFHVRYLAVADAVYQVGQSQEGNVNPGAAVPGSQLVWMKQAGSARFADYVLYLRTRQVWELKCPDTLNPLPWWRMGPFGLLLEVNAALQAIHYTQYIAAENRDAVGEARATLHYRACQGWPRSWMLLLASLGIIDDGGLKTSDVDPVARNFNWSHRVICGPQNIQQLDDFIRGVREWHEVSAVQCDDCVDGGDQCLQGCVLRLALTLYDFCMD